MHCIRRHTVSASGYRLSVAVVETKHGADDPVKAIICIPRDKSGDCLPKERAAERIAVRQRGDNPPRGCKLLERDPGN